MPKRHCDLMGSLEKMCKDYTNLAVDLAFAITDLLSRHLCLSLTLRLHCLEIDRIVKNKSQYSLDRHQKIRNML